MPPQGAEEEVEAQVEAQVRDSAPSYLTVNLGTIGTGYTLDDASFIATRLNKINVRGSNGCLSVNAVNIIELPTQAGKYYIEYNRIFSNFSELISANGNITLIVANTQSCACGEGGSTSSNLGVNYTGYVTGSNFVINTIAYTSSSTSYCF